MLYFYDEASIAGISNLVRVPGPVEKLGQVMEPDRPSDGRRTMSFCSSIVPLDEGGLRLYYSVSDFAAEVRGIAVAESADGLHWEKPALGQFQVDGQDTNRLAIAGLAEGVTRCGQPQVCRTESGTWRMYFWVNHRPYLRYAVAESDDGISWEVADFDRPAIYHPLELGSWIWTPGIPPPVDEADTGPDQKALEIFVPGPAAEWGALLHQLDADELVQVKRLRANDAAYVYRDEETGGYEFFAPWPLCNIEGGARRAEHDNAPFMLRAIHRRTSPDGLEWSDAELMIAPDEDDPLDQQFYYLAQHRQEGWRIGMLGSYPVQDQTMDIELCFSRDGRRWERPVRTPWIKREDPEEAGMVYAPNRLIDAGEHWLLLYTASPGRHGEIRITERATVRAARFPKHRFLGLRTPAGGIGHLWTRPFVLGGTEIRVDGRIDGGLRAELCEPFGRPLPGFTKGDSRVISGDDTSHVLAWEGADTQHYIHNAVSLRLEVERGTVFNIHWDQTCP